MSESKHEHQHGTDGPGKINVHHDTPAYWKRMHHDWRFWVGLVFMFAAITIYIARYDLSLALGDRSQRPMPADVAP